jgi:hypothetical protein
MTTLEAVALYHEAWQQKQGDLSDVPTHGFQPSSVRGSSRIAAPPGA